MNKIGKALIVLFILAVAGLYAVIYVVPSITGALTPTLILQYGNLSISDQSKCYIVRDERVYTAPAAGGTTYYTADGIKVRTGVRIMDVNGVADYFADFNGVVCYYYDGYENLFTPENMASLTQDQVEGLDITIHNAVADSVSQGAVLYKICNNTKWYILSWIQPGSIGKYQEGNSVTINFPDGEYVKANIERIVNNDESWLVVMSTTMYYEAFARERVTDAEIVTSEYSGIVIPNGSITSKDGAIGVYVKRKSGEYAFTQIKVKMSDGENSIVEMGSFTDEAGNKINTVDVYDEILKSPEQG